MAELKDAEVCQTTGEDQVFLDDVADRMGIDKNHCGDGIIKDEIPRMKKPSFGSIVRGMVSVVSMERMVAMHPGDAPWVSSTSFVRVRNACRG